MAAQHEGGKTCEGAVASQCALANGHKGLGAVARHQLAMQVNFPT